MVPVCRPARGVDAGEQDLDLGADLEGVGVDVLEPRVRDPDDERVG
jgi:hypothetical protein